MALGILHKGGGGKGKQMGRRELMRQREIKTCFRLPIAIGSQFDFFVVIIAKFKKRCLCVKRKRGRGRGKMAGERK